MTMVARHAGVSIATVSRVLHGTTPCSPETTAKVLHAVRELEYVPLRLHVAPSLRSEAHGLVLPSIHGPYFSELLVGLESAVRDFGQTVRLISTEEFERPTERVLELSGHVDGMVIAQATVGDSTVRKLASRMPVSLIAREPLPRCDEITVENTQSTRELTRHLIEHGRTRLVFVGDPAQARDVLQRFCGFRQALADAGLSEASGPILVPFVQSAARTVADAVAQLPDVDGLVCANDELALGTWHVLRGRGISVPGDLALTGWDDVMAAAHTQPGLTTVRQPAREVGRLAALRLHERISGYRPGPRRVVVPSEVVIRGTCGCVEPGP